MLNYESGSLLPSPFCYSFSIVAAELSPGQWIHIAGMLTVGKGHLPHCVPQSLFILFLVAVDNNCFREQPCCPVFQFHTLPLYLPSQPSMPESESRFAGSHLACSASTVGRGSNFSWLHTLVILLLWISGAFSCGIMNPTASGLHSELSVKIRANTFG